VCLPIPPREQIEATDLELTPPSGNGFLTKVLMRNADTHYMSRFTINTLLLLLMSGCAMSLAELKQALSDDTLLTSIDSDESAQTNRGATTPMAQALPRTWQVRSDAVSEAAARWPWARGNQLFRRAQILSLGPTYAELERLDTSIDARVEIEILNDLISRNTRGRYGYN
jgi:hypothetical protein